MSNETNTPKTGKKTSIGGQALIEGVMMRGPFKTAMAVRHTDGHIVTEEWETTGKDRPKWMKAPFIRGVFNMVESMVFGYKCLMRSAELSGLATLEEAEEEKRKAEKAAKKAAKKAGKPAGEPVAEVAEAAETAAEVVETAEIPEAAETVETAEIPEVAEVIETVEETAAEIPEVVPAAKEKAKSEMKASEKFWFSLAMVFSVILGVGLAVVLFMWLPVFLYNNVLVRLIPSLSGGHRWVQSVFEGVIRLALFLGYISLISLMKDIKRVFMYHGAEHKSIFCYEHGLELTVENVKTQSRFHPRCGTSFLVLALIVGILISLCIPIYDNTLLRVAVKLLTLPVVVSVGYELIKLAGRKDNLFTRIISKPGMWVQRLTTKEPDEGMMECAITALKAVIPDDPEADKW